MSRVLNHLFANSILPSMLLCLSGFFYWYFWAEPMNFSQPHGRHHLGATIVAYSWPFFLSAVVLNLLGWSLSMRSKAFSKWLTAVNFLVNGIALVFVLFGPELCEKLFKI